jgi:hypothetical protein
LSLKVDKNYKISIALGYKKNAVAMPIALELKRAENKLSVRRGAKPTYSSSAVFAVILLSVHTLIRHYIHPSSSSQKIPT